MSSRYYGNGRRTNRRRGNRKSNRTSNRAKRADPQYNRTKYAKVAPTYPSKNSAYKIATFQNPVMLGGSKLVHNQLFYDYSGILTGGLGSYPKKVYRANSVYDPNASVGVGQHNAIGFSQMMQYFEHFCVIRSKCTVTFYQGENAPARITLYLGPDDGLSGTPINMMENGQIKSATIDVNKTKVLTLDCDVKKYFGRKSYRDMLDDDQLCGDIVNAPNEQVYFIIGAYDAFAGESDITVSFDIMISYDVIYYEPKKVPQSN